MLVVEIIRKVSKTTASLTWLTLSAPFTRFVAAVCRSVRNGISFVHFIVLPAKPMMRYRADSVSLLLLSQMCPIVVSEMCGSAFASSTCAIANSIKYVFRVPLSTVSAKSAS